MTPNTPAGGAVAWSRMDFIYGDNGYPIGTDELRVHWGSEAPDEGWSPLYAQPPATVSVEAVLALVEKWRSGQDADGYNCPREYRGVLTDRADELEALTREVRK